jgi:hypothetical protein
MSLLGYESDNSPTNNTDHNLTEANQLLILDHGKVRGRK